MLIVDVMPDGKLVECYHEAVLTRLGEGLGASGNLLPEAADRTLEVVRSYVERVREAGAEVAGITTSVLRRADDSESFRTRFQAISGTELQILTGEQEATYSFVGATYGSTPDRRIAVLDIGGGSTECAVGVSNVEQAISIEIGAVRLTEMFPGLAGRNGLDAATSAANEAKRYAVDLFATGFLGLKAESVMAVAGTPRTIRAIEAKDPTGNVEGHELSSDAAGRVLDELLASDIKMRRIMVGMTAPRADILAAGAIIFRAALETLRLPSARVTRSDLLLGFVARNSEL